MEVTATEEGFEQVLDPGVEGTVGLAEPVVPDAEELLHGVLDDLLEVVGRRSGAVPGEGGEGGRGQ